MNTYMWNHPVTLPQVNLLETWGYTVIYPISKKLVCGDTGIGAMADIDCLERTILGLIAKVD